MPTMYSVPITYQRPSAPGGVYGLTDTQPPAVGGLPTDGSGGNGILGTGITWGDILKVGKDALPYILGGVGTIQAIGAQNAANDLRKEALDLSKSDYASRAPLRTRAVSILSGAMPSPPDLSALRDLSNPYAAQHTVTLPRVPVGAGTEQSLPAAPPSSQTPVPIGQGITDAMNTLPPTGTPYRPRTVQEIIAAAVRQAGMR